MLFYMYVESFSMTHISYLIPHVTVLIKKIIKKYLS